MQGNDQQAYDRGTSLFSPDGRIYQVEYAREAVKRGGASVGVRTADGIVFAAQARARSELMEAGSIEKLHKFDEHVGGASAGHVADARKLIDFARQRAQVNRLRFEEPVGVETLAKEITDHIQESTQIGGTRPYGAALLIGGVDPDGAPRLFETDPSGTPHEWAATAIGGGNEGIRSYLEDHYEDELDIEAGIDLALSAIQREEERTADEVSLATITAEEGYRVYSLE
ncbi:MAG: archaeal proteasome endopeptidase complex subunit alpha, partial [Halolamina sp.]